jgi:hypothetical protein
MIDQKQLENDEYFKDLSSLITNDASGTREIKSSIATGKRAFNSTKILFTSKLGLNLRIKLVKCYTCSILSLV